MLARQKRRRTSPEDQAILEAEYQKNSKPDKAARSEVVSRVALGEKEVQIWFQNRRQNDRRKSRPLMHHEMISHLRNSPLSTDFRPFVDDDHSLSTQQQGICAYEVSALDLTKSLPPSTHPIVTEERVPSRASSIHDLLNPSPSEQDPPSSETLSGLSMDCTAGATGLETKNNNMSQDNGSDSFDAGHSAPTNSSQDTKNMSPENAKTRKRIFAELDKSEPAKDQASIKNAASCHILDRQSNVRLSISLDGSVKVKTSEEETPSPPKDRVQHSATPTGGLHRSESASVLKELQGDKALTKARTLGATFGRSRDSRTWEFYCDSEVRDSLATQAERERSGSAAGAIGLIRSQSQSKRNSIQGHKRALTPKASGVNTMKTELPPGKQKLARSMSLLSRTQGNGEIKITQPKSGKAEKASKDDPTSHVRSPSSDSDKENWAPGTRVSNNSLRRNISMTSSNQRVILGENQCITNEADSTDTTSKRKRIRGSNPAVFLAKANRNEREDCDEEIATFMNERGSEGEDLDCVQGLLSLSQGAWR